MIFQSLYCLFNFFSRPQTRLQAALYQTDFRPVPLEEYIKVGNTIYNKQMDVVRTICKAADLGGKDPDHVVELCNEVQTLNLPFNEAGPSINLNLETY